MSPGFAPSASASFAFRKTSFGPSCASDTVLPAARIAPNALSVAGSPAKSVTFGSYCFRLTSWTALPETSTGAAARTSPEARPAAATRSTSLCGK